MQLFVHKKSHPEAASVPHWCAKCHPEAGTLNVACSVITPGSAFFRCLIIFNEILRVLLIHGHYTL